MNTRTRSRRRHSPEGCSSYTYLTANDMRKAGEKVDEALPGWTVVVDGGPYRGYDVAYKMKREEKIIELDFYSSRPGLDRAVSCSRDLLPVSPK
jgi:hypothetical protein